MIFINDIKTKKWWMLKGIQNNSKQDCKIVGRIAKSSILAIGKM